MRTFLGSLIASCSLALLAVPAFAQASLDTPALSVAQARPSSIVLDVVAGPSGAAGGFTIEWMRKSDYDRLGGWPTDPNSMYLARGAFTGTPTLNTDPDSPTYQLGPGADILIEVGDLFDETGVAANFVSELPDGQDYTFRVRANAAGGIIASPNSEGLKSGTVSKPANCTYSQGYWKNHTDIWPVASLKLGNVTYSASQLQQIFGRPAKGNGLISLAHQMIAAKLNSMNGADPTSIQSTISVCDVMIGNLIVPPVGTGFLSPLTTDPDTHSLDDFNNGLLGPGHCATTAAHPTTWGEVKSLYR